MLVRGGVAGVTVVGPAACRDTTLAREFLYRNFEPFTWYDSASPEGAAAPAARGSPGGTPVVRCPAGNVLVHPSLRDLAKGAGMWRTCPDRAVDLAVVGAGSLADTCVHRLRA
jgi:thioredoxin reductase (NADPH)